MNKLFSKIATLSVGLGLAIGVGVAVGSQKEAKVAKAAVGDIYQLVTDASTLSAGDKIVFASGIENSVYLLSTNQKTSNREATGPLDVVNGQVTLTAAVQIVTLEAASTNWAFNTGSGYLYAASSGSNQLKTDENLTDNGKWSISITNTGVATITAQGTNTRNVMRYNYNGGSPLFACYASSSTTGNLPSIYKSTGSVAQTYTISYNANGGSGEMESTVGGDPVVAECTFTAPSGKRFSKWNTKADGTGTDYAVGAKPGADVELFAIWEDKPACATLNNLGSTLSSTANTQPATVNITDDDVTYTLNYLQCKKQGDSMLLVKNVGAYIGNHTIMPAQITSVEVFINSGAAGDAMYDVAFGTTEFTSAEVGFGGVNIKGGESYLFTNTTVAGAKYFVVSMANAKNGQVLKLVINYSDATVISYTAAMFSEELLTATDEYCSVYTEESDFNYYKGKMTNIWTLFGGANKYKALSTEDKTALSQAQANPDSENDVEKAMARYDFITSKYGLTSFISGRPPVPNQSSFIKDMISTSRTGIVVIIALVTTTTLAVGLFFVLKKKKHN